MHYDVVLVGGGIMGSSAAYHLAVAGHAAETCVVEPDPTYEFAATPRATGTVRQIFSEPENIRMSQYGREVYGNFAALMAVDGDAPDVNFRKGGYSFLVRGKEAVRVIEANWRTQTGLGANALLLDGKGYGARFPSINVRDVDAAVYSPDDGWIDPYAALMGFRRKAARLGVKYLKDRVVGLEANGRRVRRVVLESGARIEAGRVVNVANCWAPAICAMVGMRVPVEPMRRQTFYFECRAEIEPLGVTRELSGLSFRPEGRGYIGGLTRREPAGFNWSVEPEWFESDIWPKLANRVPKFEAIKLGRAWSGHYDENRFDGNVIIGPWTGGLENFYVACGFSGHGLQHGPAIGRALKELLLDGGYRTIDLSRFSYKRILDNRPVYEVGPPS
ncbi:MAG: FAD-binding oxidoreductase [Proteobacteria bacterium]|nr:FAD-binding oxidoreductase [Pseudomonadota bacterium]